MVWELSLVNLQGLLFQIGISMLLYPFIHAVTMRLDKFSLIWQNARLRLKMKNKRKLKKELLNAWAVAILCLLAVRRCWDCFGRALIPITNCTK